MGQTEQLVHCSAPSLCFLHLVCRLVLYLPSALSLVSDYFYIKRPGDSEMYDTIVAAKEILKSVYAVYGGESGSLSALSRTQTETTERDLGQTLEDVCKIGMSSGDPVSIDPLLGYVFPYRTI